SSSSSSVPSTVTPTTTSSISSTGTVSAVSPTPLRETVLKGEQAKNRWGKSISPVSNLHRHFSSMSLSSARIRMPPRLEEMLREGNRRVQLERVQYSQHYFAFISSATAKSLATASLHPAYSELLHLAAVKSFSSFLIHNGLFASSDLVADDSKSSFRCWAEYMRKLLANQAARLWFVSNVLFCHEISVCFLFAPDKAVRSLFRQFLTETIREAEVNGDASDLCLDQRVASPYAYILVQSMRQFPRLSHMLISLLGALPFKHSHAFRSEPLEFYRAINDLVFPQHPERSMVMAVIRGGILNTLLHMFSPQHATTDFSSLHRKDSMVYEQLHRLVAHSLRMVRMEANGGDANPWRSTTNAIRREEMPDLHVITSFYSKDGGYVKFMTQVVDLLRRTNRSAIASLDWVTDGLLFLCYGHADTSCTLIDIVCPLMGLIMNECGALALKNILAELFAIDDKHTETRFEHLFHKAQLTSMHSQPSAQGLVEILSVPESRLESLLEVTLLALHGIPRVVELVCGDEQVFTLLSKINALCMCRQATNPLCSKFIEWFDENLTGEPSTSSRSEECTTTENLSQADSAMEDGGGSVSEREKIGGGTAAHSNSIDHIISQSSCFSSGQLSPSSRLGAMTLAAGEKRPLPPAEEGEEEDGDGSADRKRSIGETEHLRRGTWAMSPTPLIEDYAGVSTSSSTTAPMEDSDLLISSSHHSTAWSSQPSAPPPAYTEVMGGGGGGG
ncbi:hypothetical protein PFISCL1PPCAC_25181, partial [Pristionchus fissidentatus]